MIKHILSCNPMNDSSYTDVQVNNPSSGSIRTYTLKVDVWRGELFKIYSPNGGWLDDYYAAYINDKGFVYQDWLVVESNCNL
ncbi:hypothetical protein NLM59_04595 [Weeksellaceae bacterium KMM 9724]|uniref:hypothetical protein n=1 Tax=Profundicola chukchiensis TaxID=2961959 RepID=UPI00243EC904|nr:hypothetical protein [Profundicola chukchiensis]MDG4950193.1 hypothetical protein [Profundicola chukchiensis]